MAKNGDELEQMYLGSLRRAVEGDVDNGSMMAGQIAALVHIHLADNRTALIFLRHLLDHRRDHAAGAAPRRPEIHHHGHILCRQDGIKIAATEFHCHNFLLPFCIQPFCRAFSHRRSTWTTLGAYLPEVLRFFSVNRNARNAVAASSRPRPTA